MDDQQLHEKIEAYLQQQLSPEEAAAFEAQIAADPVLAERVTNQRLVLRAIDRLAEQSLQGKFARWRIEADAEETALNQPLTSARKTSPWLLAAIMLLILAGAYWLFYPPPPTPPPPPPPPLEETVPAPIVVTPDDKAARLLALSKRNLNEYGKRLPSSIIRGGGHESPEDSLLAQADSLLKINQYEQYKSAATLLKTIPPGSPFEPSALKRLAFTYHKLGQHALAIATYEKYASLTPFNEEEHDWVLCLYYLADWPQHQKEFKARLRKMTGNSNHGYRPKAQQLKMNLRAAGWKDG